MTSDSAKTRPKGYKAVTLLGIFHNSLCLAVLYPLSIYFEYTNPEKIPMLGLMSTISNLISIPLTSILLVAAIGLFFKQYWSRELCLWALSAELLFGICYQTIDSLVRIANWTDDTIYSLALIPLVFLSWIAQAAVMVFLSSDGVKNYLSNYRKGANG